MGMIAARRPRSPGEKERDERLMPGIGLRVIAGISRDLAQLRFPQIPEWPGWLSPFGMR